MASTINDLDTPALLVDLDRLEQNISDMAALVSTGGKTLRPHTKTHKCPEIARMQLAAGAEGLTVAKLGEAEALADAGITDLFIANEIVGHLKVERLLRLLERARVRVGVDSMEVAGPIGDTAASRGITVPVMLEVDSGHHRAGVRSVEEAVTLAERIAGRTGVRLEGIFTHEGHLYNFTDASTRSAAAREAASRMQEVASALAAAGLTAVEVSVGSTPGAQPMAQEPGITEIRAGVYVFNDRMQMLLGADEERCALTVLSTVTSVRPDGWTLLDAGSKALGTDKVLADRTYGCLFDAPEVTLGFVSEEHGHLGPGNSTRFRVGDKVRIVPNHACTCVNMHDTLYAHRGEAVEGAWRITGRGRIR